jgi:hypothetical protein
MTELGGIHKIDLLRRLCISYQLIADLLFAAGSAVLAGCALYALFSWPVWWWTLLFFIVIFGCIAIIRRSWEVDKRTITSFLNFKYPELEESCDLVLKDPDELNLLEKLQLVKVRTILEAVPATQKQFMQRLKLSILFFLIVPVFGLQIAHMHDTWHSKNYNFFETFVPGSRNKNPEKILPQIESINVTVTPPTYTGKQIREQDKFALDEEEGSVITWKLKLNTAVKQVSLLFNSGETLVLKNKGNDASYYVEKRIDKPGFYQVNVDGKLSDLYEVRVIKDNPPTIHIKTPTQYTHIDAGEKPEVNASVSVDDDYGVSNVFIYATVAKGSGEAVKFKEQRIDFTTSFKGHNRYYELQKLISLSALGMGPGDELYFYVQAQDNHNQQSRTDVYIVAIQDTAQLLSMDGILSGVNVKPEYFRSERQIILDSQKLLPDRDSISKEAFNNRSNDLGMDQKLLRLRYGKFLGEESESGVGDPGSENDKLADPKDFGNGAKILDEYTDKHDNAEDAQFFDPTVKAQLKATLTEMWKAELQLRLYKPDAALPFEFKALRLLKDLQQKSRMYVAKTAYNPSPLKMGKRLSGDLDKIIQPVSQQDIKMDNSQYGVFKNAIPVLERLKEVSALNDIDRHTLQLANQQLSEKASTQPGIYLPAVSALRHILSAAKIKNNDVATVEKGIQRILPFGGQLPNTLQSSDDMGLSKGYYNKLNHLTGSLK